MKGFGTKAVHGSIRKKDPHGSLRVPVYDSVAFEFENAEQIQQAFEGRRLAHSYTRISNPTVEEYEDRVRVLTDAAGVVAVASGMAAIADVIAGIAESGSRIVTSRFLFGNTYSLFEHTLKPWGLEVAYVDLTNRDQVAAAITPNTRAVFFETITNPQLQVPDAHMLAELAHARGVPLIADGTMTTPYLFPTKDFGVDIEVLSSTKYFTGGATTIGGLILDYGRFDWKKHPRLAPWAEKYGPHAFQVRLRREINRNWGTCLAPHNAYLQTLGLETVSLRIDKSCRNTLEIAKVFQKDSRIGRVNYPGLDNSPDYPVASRQFRHGFGGILTFELGSKADCFRFMDRLKLIRRATNINDNKTLILHPASTIFCEYSIEERQRMGVGESLIRLSVGIEDVEDLLEDIRQALET